MATVHNPTGFDVFCHRLGRSIRPGEKVEVTDAEAAGVPTGVFEVTRDAPVRQMVRRGSKVAEVNGPPEVEVR
jgi:hypothetical protein